MDLYEFVKERAVEIGEQFETADDDWSQMAFFEGKDEAVMGIFPLDSYMDDKDLLDKVILPHVIEEAKAQKAIILLNAWFVNVPGSKDLGLEDLPAPSEHPDRREALILMEFTPDGIERSEAALIVRDETHPPKLVSWTDWGAGKTEGRFMDNVTKALRKVAMQAL